MGKKSKRPERAQRALQKKQQQLEQEREAQEIQWYEDREVRFNSPSCEWKEMADKRRQEFIECSKQDSVRRVFLFEVYRQYLLKLATNQCFKGASFFNREDKKLVLKLIQDSSELCYVRAMATDLWSLRRFCECEYEHAVQLLVQSAKLCKEAPKCELEIELGVLKGLKKGTTVGDLLQIFTLASGASVFLSPDCNLGPESGFTGGFQCDSCAKSMEDPLKMLQCCTACKKSYYCSPECQTRDWHEHKQLCRKKGQFKVDDVAIYSGADDGPMVGIIHGTIVKLLAPAPLVGDNVGWPKAWHARAVMTNKKCSIQTEDLVFLRPALQKTAAKLEAQFLLEQLGIKDSGVQKLADLRGGKIPLDPSWELSRFWIPNNWWLKQQRHEGA